MLKRVLEKKLLHEYIEYLINEERSHATIQKYSCDIRKFYEYIGKDNILNKDRVMSYKEELQRKYKASSVNSIIIALNGFFEFNGWSELRLKTLKIQKNIFISENKDLNEKEYMRLLNTAKSKNNERLVMLMQSICSTGIRVSEHKYMTVEALQKGYMTIQNKGKIREIFFPIELKKGLIEYCKKRNICKGPIFITRNGKVLDRSNIYRMMQSLCQEAGINQRKVCPHNLRHLFAVTYYSLDKDVIHLADILGHSSVETTRIYLKSNGQECQKVFNQMNLYRMTI
ncbi:MAG: tyrosine-type recombinase/integrase [Longibaculum sp.]